MAATAEIANYLSMLELEHRQLQDGMWLVKDASGQIDIVVRHDAPVLVLRAKVLDLPEGRSHEALFRALLQLNATGMVHGAYALEGDAVIAVDTLRSDTLDIEELQASIDSLSLAVTTHVPVLARLLAE